MSRQAAMRNVEKKMLDGTVKISIRKVERRHHKVDALPREVRDELVQRFMAGETYDHLARWLADLGHKIGRSSVHRWGKPFEKQLQMRLLKIEAYREGSAKIVAGLKDIPGTQLNEAAEQSITQMLLEAQIDLDEAALDVEKRTKVLSQLAHALTGLGYSAATRERLKLAFRKEWAGEAARKVATAVGDAKVDGRSVVATVREALGLEA
jgi:hypothetical protein